MAETFAGFELPEGQSIDSLEQWPSFAEWFEREYGFPADSQTQPCKEVFTAYIQGAYWQWRRMVFGD